LKDHKERLDRYRNRKDWDLMQEQDEQDIEGERLLADIRNYKAEHFFNTNFYM
jgi:hypothetical protein